MKKVLLAFSPLGVLLQATVQNDQSQHTYRPEVVRVEYTNRTQGRVEIEYVHEGRLRREFQRDAFVEHVMMSLSPPPPAAPVPVEAVATPTDTPPMPVEDMAPEPALAVTPSDAEQEESDAINDPV